MKAYIPQTAPDRGLKNRGGKKKHQCPCCFSGKTVFGQKCSKTSMRQKAKKEIQDQLR